MFGPNGAGDQSLIHLGFLQPYFKSVVTNLGIKMGRDFKMDMLINYVLKYSFYQLRLVTLSLFHHFMIFDYLIYTFITTPVDYWKALYVVSSQNALSCLHLVQMSLNWHTET